MEIRRKSARPRKESRTHGIAGSCSEFLVKVLGRSAGSGSFRPSSSALVLVLVFCVLAEAFCASVSDRSSIFRPVRFWKDVEGWKWGILSVPVCFGLLDESSLCGKLMCPFLACAARCVGLLLGHLAIISTRGGLVSD